MASKPASSRRRGRRRASARAGSASSQLRASNNSTPQPLRNSPFSHIQIVSRDTDPRSTGKRKDIIPEDWEDDLLQCDEPDGSAARQAPSYQETTAREGGRKSASFLPPAHAPPQSPSRSNFADAAGVGPQTTSSAKEDCDYRNPDHEHLSRVVKSKFMGRGKGRKGWEPLDLSTLGVASDFGETAEANPTDPLEPAHLQAQAKMFKESEAAMMRVQALHAHFDHCRRIFGDAMIEHRDLLSHPGSFEKQVTFTLDANGDVSARHWIASAYQWRKFAEFFRSTNSLDGHPDFLALWSKVGYDGTSILERFKKMAVAYQPRIDANAEGEFVEGRYGAVRMAREPPVPQTREHVPPHMSSLHDFRSFSSASLGSPEAHRNHRQHPFEMDDPFTSPSGRPAPGYNVTGMLEHRASVDPDFRFPMDLTASHQAVADSTPYPTVYTSPVYQTPGESMSHHAMYTNPEIQQKRELELQLEKRARLAGAQQYLQHNERWRQSMCGPVHEAPLHRVSPYASSEGPLGAHATSGSSMGYERTMDPGMSLSNPIEKREATQACAPRQQSESDNLFARVQAQAGVPDSSSEPFAHQLQPRQQDNANILAMREYLRRMEVPASKIPSDTPSRTVLNDPLLSGRVNIEGIEHNVSIGTSENQNKSRPTTSSIDPAAAEPAVDALDTSFRSLRLSSDPDPYPAPNTPIFDVTGRNVRKAVYDDTRGAYDQPLNDWRSSGGGRTRMQPESSQRAQVVTSTASSPIAMRSPISARHSSLAFGPGPIERPTPSTRSKQKSAELKAVSAKTSSELALLLPRVIENLAQYPKERDDILKRAQNVPEEVRNEFIAQSRPYFARFVYAKASVNNSFFSDAAGVEGDGEGAKMFPLSKKDSKMCLDTTRIASADVGEPSERAKAVSSFTLDI